MKLSGRRRVALQLLTLPFTEAVEQLERAMISNALTFPGGHCAAARRLCIRRQSLYTKITTRRIA